MKSRLFTLSLLALSCLTLISCNQHSDDETAPTPTTDQVITPISPDKCDNQIIFSGISEVVDITDTTVKIKWDLDPKSIGYTVFKITGDSFSVMANTTSMENESIISGLVEESEYKFLVRSINVVGAYDCNQNIQDVITTEKQTFVSCNEIHSYYQGVKPSGIYSIDPDLSGSNLAFDVHCDMDNNNGGWTRVFQHQVAEGLFADDLEAKENQVDNPDGGKYSILSKLEQFKRDGKYEFWIYYPEYDGIDGGNRWNQISNPVTDLIDGYVALNEDYTDMYWGGLEKSSYSGTLIDGSVGSGWWFYAIGSNKNWNGAGKIPGPIRNQGITEVQLFVK